MFLHLFEQFRSRRDRSSIRENNCRFKSIENCRVLTLFDPITFPQPRPQQSQARKFKANFPVDSRLRRRPYQRSSPLGDAPLHLRELESLGRNFFLL